jgi:hypothetical protein
LRSITLFLGYIILDYFLRSLTLLARDTPYCIIDTSIAVMQLKLLIQYAVFRFKLKLHNTLRSITLLLRYTILDYFLWSLPLLARDIPYYIIDTSIAVMQLKLLIQCAVFRFKLKLHNTLRSITLLLRYTILDYFLWTLILWVRYVYLHN